MTFSIYKPDSGPSPKIDVDQIRDNFAVFGTSLAENHTALNNRNQGCHEGVLFEQQSATPTIAGTYAALYAKSVTYTIGTQPQLFARLPVFLPTADDTRGSGNDPMQLTYHVVNIAGPQYQSFVAGGFVVYFGQTNDITIPITLSPSPSQIISVSAATHNMTTVGTAIPWIVGVNILSSNSFKIESPLNFSGPVVPYIITWMAVAKQ